MTYALITDLKATIPTRDLELLTDFDGAAGTVDDARLESALLDATAEINGYIAKAVQLPLQSPPDMLRVVCRDLAVHRLYANIGNVTEAQGKLREGAISYLKMVRDGKVSIGDADGGAEIQTSDGVVTVEGPDRVMTRDSLRNF